MASTKVRFAAPPGLTIVIYLQKFGATSFVNSSGHAATEVSISGISTGDYEATVTEAAIGWHRVYLVQSGKTTSFGSYTVFLQDDTNTYIAIDDDHNLAFTLATETDSPTTALITNGSPYLNTLDYVNKSVSEQAEIDGLILAGTEFIEKYCNRTFKKQTYTDEKQDGNGWDTIFIDNPPINSLTDIDLVTYNAVTGDTETTTHASSKFTFEANTGEIRFKPNVVLDSAKLFPNGFQNIQITYNGGFAAIPEPIRMLCADFVIQMFDITQAQEALEREKVGDYFYALAQEAFKRLPFSKKRILSSYKLRKV